MTQRIFYHNGEYVNAENVSISPDDRGFRFGDGVFETIPVYRAKPYQVDWHLKRLEAGLSALQIGDPGLTREDVMEIIRRNTVIEGFVRIMISRGEGSHGYLPDYDITSNVLMEAFQRTEPLPDEPANLFLSSYKKPSLDMLPVNVKLAQGLNSTLARMEAQDKNCFEALQLNVEGHICEASSANIFWVVGNKIYTPPLSTGCLNGSTRAALMRIVSIYQAKIPLASLQEVDEVFLTNCNWQVLPVTELRPMGWKWKSGSTTAHLHDLLKRDIAKNG
jgi:branched-subunit amino acid aminotransferase/4-amino-4-deoxychorismate lyase